MRDAELQFTHDQVFSSPSAAAVIVGHAKNGRTDWKVPDSGLSYGDWQTRGIEEPTEDETA